MMDKIHRFIRNGPPDDSPVDLLLQTAFWKLVGELRMSYDDWKRMMRDYTTNPLYAAKSKAAPNERSSRLTNVLTGGSSKGIPSDFSWKSLMEALVVIGTSELRITCEATRGKFNTKKTAHTVCRPGEEVIANINQLPLDYSESTTPALARYFQNPEHTARNVMTHPLLRLLWTFFLQFGIDEAMWRKLSTRYVNDPKNCVASEKRRSDKRHNLQHSIRATDRLTWRKFLEALKAIDCKELTVTFTIDAQNKPLVEHTFTVDLTKLTFWSSSNEPE